MKKLVIIDYGMGNLHSVIKALQKMKIPAVLSDKAEVIKAATGIILPGVGAFADAIKEIRKRGLYNIIRKEALAGKPILGVCLGHQLLFSHSEEFGATKGLDLINGRVIKFKTDLKVPHMGWNNAKTVNQKSTLLKGIKDNRFYYFVHSFYAVPVEKKVILTETQYGDIRFVSAVEKENIFGVQFHPEKSGEPALKIYKNFWKVCSKK